MHRISRPPHEARVRCEFSDTTNPRFCREQGTGGGGRIISNGGKNAQFHDTSSQYMESSLAIHYNEVWTNAP